MNLTPLPSILPINVFSSIQFYSNFIDLFINPSFKQSFVEKKRQFIEQTTFVCFFLLIFAKSITN